MAIGGIMTIFCLIFLDLGLFPLFAGQFLIALPFLTLLILGIILFIFGWRSATYIKVQKEYTKVFCPNCGQKNEMDSTVCSNCEYSLHE